MDKAYVQALMAGAKAPTGQSKFKFVNGQYIDPDEVKPQAKKQTGRGGILSSLISEGGAATGAAVGSLLGPLGTIAGAGIGGFIGRLGENKFRDNEFKVGSAVGEGLTSGAFAGAGQAFKAIKGVKASKGLASALGGTDEATALVKGAGRTTMPGYLERKGLDKVAQAGGYFPKDNVPGIGKISTNEVNKYYDVLKKLKIKPNDAGDIEKQVTDRLGKLNSIFDTQLSAANKKFSPSEIKTFSDEIKNAFTKQGGVTPDAEKYLRAQLKKLRNVKDIKELHTFRKQLDDTINWGANPDSATAQMQAGAKALREGIKNKLNSAVPGLKDTNNLYHDLTDIQKLTLRATGRVNAEATSAGGSIGARILSSPTANTMRAKVGGLMKEVGPYSAGTGGTITAGTSQLRRQLPADLVGAMGGSMQPQEMPQDQQTQDMGGMPVQDSSFGSEVPQALGMQAPDMVQEAPQSMYSLEQALQDYQNAPNAKAQKQVMDYYDFVSKAEAAQNKAAGAVAGGPNITKVTGQQYVLANRGANAVQQLAQLIGNDPGVVNRLATPGRKLPIVGGSISKAAGTGDYDAISYNVANALLRLETGAQANPEEIKNLQTQLMPRAGDSPETIQIKLQQLQEAFSAFLNTANGQDAMSGANDLSSLIQGYGGM